MASDSQLALARPPRNQLAVPKAARQMVPAFLQKLYQMVNDDKNRDLITWSEAGDSFFVLDHERFAREVLGHWFKHQRFSSFVRQLNMYGFHKIPHLQQGVLRSDSDTEYWNFTHPNFRRDQPDLLCLIQRKKQSAALAQDGAIDIRDPNTPAPSAVPAITNTPASPSPAISLTQGQLLDMHSIIQGIAAIKRHQTTISSELTELKQNNQFLFSESRIVRTKLQNQQELIDRILKFLAGVFGSAHSSGGGAAHRGGRRSASSDELDALMRGSDANKAVIPTRRRTGGGRLMIEAAKVSEGSGKPGIVELEDLREGEAASMSENNYAVETPVSDPSPSPSEIIGETKDRPDSSVINTNPTPHSSIPQSESNIPTSPQTNTHLELDRALTPTNNHLNHHNNDTFEINQPWANMFGGRGGITNDQLTQLLAVLAQAGGGGGSAPNTLDESLSGFDQHSVGYTGHESADAGLGFNNNGEGGFGGQGVVQPGQIQGGGGGGQPSSASSSSPPNNSGGNQLTWPPPFSPGGFDFTSFLQNMSPPGSAGLPSLPSASAAASTFHQQQQQGLSSYGGLLEDSLVPGRRAADEDGLIHLDSSVIQHNGNSDKNDHGDTQLFGGGVGAGAAVPLSPPLARQFQSTREVEKEVDDMDRQVNQWIEQLGPIFGNVVGKNGGGAGGEGNVNAAGVGTSAADIPHVGMEDLDFDSFLNISGAGDSRGGGGGGQDEDEDVFGEEDEEDEESDGAKGGYASASASAPALSTSLNATTTTTTNGKKRKSDVAMVVDENMGDGAGAGAGGGKVKRRKD